MNHFFHQIQGWFNFENLYKNLAHSLPNHFHFAEVGVWKGRSLAYFVVESLNANKSGTVYAVDHWLGSEEHTNPSSPSYDPLLLHEDGLYKHFLANINPIRDYVSIIRKPSVQAAQYVRDKSLDAIFIDASHKYQDVLDDLRAWYPKMKSQGLFLGHDFDWSEVNTAVHTFAKEIEATARPVDASCWIIQ